ncbi:vWA domain-containing protein [Oceanirhabdus sp. W0125-5]|uniref:vWA domain-containing protein n=1 Tax=Oceanirhabdus sp. W0125-5 TaxID=2999116 RepID=UPI0022F2FF00|nr:VWA domain-containing protein [Oceanirhabdus sp. W0125-5]WBW98254.1 VWA domain-containing protein [Oceanirhabdus sp. W0125-5]
MNNLEFKYPLNIFYLVIPVLVLCILILGSMKKEKIMKRIKLQDESRFKLIRSILIISGLGFLVLSLMGPQIFKGVSEVESRGLDIYVLIDTSKSMLVEDVKPSRISRAVKITEKILDNLHGDRIGFIPFSSSAYVQMPLTDDYSMAKMFLNVVDTDLISGGGSNIGNAMKLAQEAFNETSAESKVILILSDGEDHNSKSVEVLKRVKDEKLKVFTVGIGTEKGGLIPIYDPESGKKIGYKKDRNGETIISKLDSISLKNIASEGNGTYYRSTVEGDEIDSLLKEITKLERSTFKSRKIKNYRQIYQYFLGLGLLFFIFAYILPERRNVK